MRTAACCFPGCSAQVDIVGMAPSRGFCESHWRKDGIVVGSLVCVGRRYVMGVHAGDPGEVVPDEDTGRLMRVVRMYPASKWGGPTADVASDDDPDGLVDHSMLRLVRVSDGDPVRDAP